MSRVTRGRPVATHRRPVGPRRWLPPVRTRTIIAGVALGAILFVVLIFAGAVGADPLPRLDRPRPGPPQDAGRGTITAVQPEPGHGPLSPTSENPAEHAQGGPGRRPGTAGHEASRRYGCR